MTPKKANAASITGNVVPFSPVTVVPAEGNDICFDGHVGDSYEREKGRKTSSVLHIVKRSCLGGECLYPLLGSHFIGSRNYSPSGL